MDSRLRGNDTMITALIYLSPAP